MSPPLPADVWEGLPSQVQALILSLRAEVAKLQALIQDLRAQLNQNSTNSSRPPSTDPPHIKRRPPTPPSGRKSGGQPGHARRQRPLLPPGRTLTCKPAQCRVCGEPLDGADPHPLRYALTGRIA